MSKPFDHDRHCRLLEEADRELTILGKTELAAAVSKARLIHIDLQGRIATGRRELARLQKLVGQVGEVSRTLDNYTLQPAGPWIGCELFPKAKPDGTE